MLDLRVACNTEHRIMPDLRVACSTEHRVDNAGL